MKIKKKSEYLVIKLVFLIIGVVLFFSNCAGFRSVIPGGIFLERELVELKLLNNNRVHVRVTYYYQGRIASLRRLAFPVTEWFMLEEFKATWAGKKLRVEYRKAREEYDYFIGSNKYAGLYVYDLPRTNKYEVISENEYYFKAPYYGPGTKTFEPEGYYVEYILVTGATWKGPIGKLDVVFDPGDVPCSDLTQLKGSYAGRCMPDNTWRFSAVNIEPVRNIRLLYR